MRTHQVTRDEVYIYTRTNEIADTRTNRIAAFPMDVCDETGSFPSSLFADLLAALPALARNEWVWVEGRLSLAEVSVAADFDEEYRFDDRPCSTCRKTFVRSGRYPGRYCSNACERRAKHAAEVARRATLREAARANLVCRRCGVPIAAQRSTRAFCSDRCRIAAFRKQHGRRRP